MTEEMNFVPCISWIKRGIAKQIPDKVTISKEELKTIIESQKQAIRDVTNESEVDLENAGNEINSTSTSQAESADEMVKYNFDNYDDEEEEQATDVLAGLAGLTVFATNDDDPYVTLKDEGSDSDAEDFQIRPDDNLIVVGHVEGDCSGLEVYVYNEKEDDLYIHHDIMLPAVPLCIEWLNYDAAESDPGNFVAVGYMTNTIDVWDIDMVNTLEPVCKLGKQKKKKKGNTDANSILGHSDAVLDLSWNTNVRNILASGSADKTVALWDLSGGTIVTSINQFSEKVQTLQWHPFEAQTLLVGACDSTVKLFDCRDPNSANKTWALDGEVERVIWNHLNPLKCLASTDTGFVFCLDPRADKPVWQISAHSTGCTGLALSSQCPGCLVTGSVDKTIKVWDIQDDHPTCISEKPMNMGQIYCLQSCPDSPFVFCSGGDNRSHNFAVSDINGFNSVASRFNNRGMLIPTTSAVVETMEVESVPSSNSAGTDLNSGNSSRTTGSFEKKGKLKKIAQKKRKK